MKIIVGLGNIGDKYILTRHNVGFLLLDRLVQQITRNTGEEIQWQENTKLKSLTAKITYENRETLLVKPTTLMNRSGESVSSVLNFYKATLDDLIVIYDDIDLPLGKLRIRQKGSAGTHNGLKSVIAELGKETFARIRIGIESRGEIAPKLQDLSSFVLTEFSRKEKEILVPILDEAILELKKMIA